MGVSPEIAKQPRSMTYREYDNMVCALEDCKVLLDGHSHEIEVLKARITKCEPSGVAVEQS